MKLLTCFFASLLLLFSFSLSASDTKPKIDRQPQWVKPVMIDYTDTHLDDEAEDGYSDLLYEQQVSLAQQSVFTRKAMRVLSETGAENLSQVSVDYDPSFQQLSFHTIQIIRDHKVISRLDLSKIKTIQQEKELDRSIYDGSLTAMLILEDLRKDDILEYSYTIRGFNPIFKNKYAEANILQFSVPVYTTLYRVITPKERILHIKNTGTDVPPKAVALANETAYEWELKDQPGIPVEKSLPSWYDPYPTVFVSEFNSWKEVVEWALELFPFSNTLPDGLQRKVNELKSNYGTDEERVLAALRFVQDDIRYMGIEMGENSHKPHAPAQVLQHRFGDCKDKAYLLCTLLRGLGIEAWPVLINTYYKKTISSWLPSPYAFNHTTVAVNLKGKTYWFDATIAYQRGQLNNISFPDYQSGLVIKPGIAGLSDIPLQNNGRVQTKEAFYIKSLHAPAKLVVTTTFSGSYADNIRYDIKSNSKKELQKSYRELYASYFKKITADSMSYDDNSETGELTTREYYTIRDFWQTEKDMQKVLLEPFLINSVISKPDHDERNMPYSLLYPAYYTEDVEIHLPDDWPIEEDGYRYSASEFTFSYRYSQPASDVVLLHYEYENTSDHISPENFGSYLSELEKAEKTMAFELTNNLRVAAISTATDTSKSSNRVFTGIYVLLGICALATYIYKRNNRPRNNYWD